MMGPSRVHGFCEKHWGKAWQAFLPYLEQARMKSQETPLWIRDFLARVMMRGWIFVAQKKGLVTATPPPKEVRESFKREMEEALQKGGCIVCMTVEEVLDNAIQDTLNAMPNVGAG